MPSSRATEGWKQGFVLAEQAFPQLSYGLTLELKCVVPLELG